MKLVISSTGQSIESNVDMRFGRCAFFIVVELDENNNIISTQALQNQGNIQGHGAGIVASQQVGNLKPDAVITGNLGPNSSMVLSNLNIPVYFSDTTVKDAINNFINGSLRQILGPTQQKHNIPQQHTQPPQQNDQKNTDQQTHENKEVVLIPLSDNNGYDSLISEHFGHAEFFGIYKNNALEIIQNNLDHNAEKPPAEQIIEQINPTIIFVKSIGLKAENIFLKHNIKIKTGEYSKAKEVLDSINSLRSF